MNTVHGLIGTFGDVSENDRLWIVAGGPQGDISVGVEPNTLVVNLGSCCVNDIITTSPLAVGTWTHIALTFDYVNDVYTLYFNGQFAASSTALRDPPTHAVSFGGITSDFGQFFFFPGRLDEVTLYSRVLSPSEILAIYNAGSAGKCIPMPDADGDGVPDAEDVCPGTVIPEEVPTVRLGVNRFALTNNDTIFDTVAPPGGGPRSTFTTEDTKGCSCAQIIQMLGLGQGQRNFGCSIGIMQEWINMVNP